MSQGGGALGNGSWLVVGGNQAVTTGGATANSQTGGPPYDDPDGGTEFLPGDRRVIARLRAGSWQHISGVQALRR